MLSFLLFIFLTHRLKKVYKKTNADQAQDSMNPVLVFSHTRIPKWSVCFPPQPNVVFVVIVKGNHPKKLKHGINGHMSND